MPKKSNATELPDLPGAQRKAEFQPLFPIPSMPAEDSTQDEKIAWTRTFLESLSKSDQQKAADMILQGFVQLARNNPAQLAKLPDDIKTNLQAAVMRRYRAMRKSKNARPQVKRPCKYCGELFGARDLRLHQPRCPKVPTF